MGIIGILPRRDYEVGGLKLKKGRGRWPFKVLKDHNHCWFNEPRAGCKSAAVIQDDRKGCTLVTFCGVETVTLHSGYAWDGNTVPPVMKIAGFGRNTRECLRASALHDVWCQAMSDHIFENSLCNWQKAACEYREICLEDGMCRTKAERRCFFINVYGCWKKFRGKID